MSGERTRKSTWNASFIEFRFAACLSMGRWILVNRKNYHLKYGPLDFRSNDPQRVKYDACLQRQAADLLMLFIYTTKKEMSFLLFLFKIDFNLLIILIILNFILFFLLFWILLFRSYSWNFFQISHSQNFRKFKMVLLQSFQTL